MPSVKKRPFAKVSDLGFDRIQALATDASPSAFKLFMFLAKHCDGRSAIIVSVKQLTLSLGFGERTVTRAVSDLAALGAIAVAHIGGSRCFFLNRSEICRTSGDVHGFFTVSTTAIIGDAENPAFLGSFKHLFTPSAETLKEAA